VAPRPTGSTGKYGVIAPAERRLVSLAGFADMIGVSRSKAHQLAVSGDVETVRVGRRLLVVVSSIDAYVAKLRDAS
jgi:hypothetical protein